MSIDLDAIPDDRLAEGITWAAMNNVGAFDTGPIIDDDRIDSIDEWGEMNSGVLLNGMKDIFRFTDEDDYQMGLVRDIVSEINNESGQGNFVAQDVVAAMTRLDIKPSDFLYGAVKVASVDLVDSPPDSISFNDGKDFTLGELDPALQPLMLPIFHLFGDTDMADPSEFSMTNGQLNDAIEGGGVTLVDGPDGEVTLEVDLDLLDSEPLVVFLNNTEDTQDGEGYLGEFKEETFITAMENLILPEGCLLYTSPSPRDQRGSRMPSSA